MRLRCLLTGDVSTAIAGLSSSRAPRSGATRTGAAHEAFALGRVTTYRCGLPVLQGVERRNEKYCRPVRSIPVQGSAAHASTGLFGRGNAVVVLQVRPPSVEL